MDKPEKKKTQWLGLNETFLVAQSWRLLLIAFLAGGLIGAAIYSLFPPPYRARTVITIDHNLEAIFPTSPDREIFYFLERETNKLEELAWSDQVLQRTVSIAGISSVNALRNGILQLSQPGDGGWKLYATSTDPHIAKIIANAWGDAFEEVVREGADIERSVLAIQTTLAAGSVTDTVELDRLSHDLAELQQSSLGIHPLLQITRSQKSDIQVIRKSSQGLYIFSGAMITLMITLIMVLLFPPKTESGHEN